MSRMFKVAVWGLLGSLLLLLFAEGASSFFLTLQALKRPVLERSHTRYDPLLGWVNVPDTFVKDLYGKGKSLRINSKGFRDTRRDFVELPAEGKTRIVCSGDSFTLGYGVDDSDTWCHRLTLLDNRLETVNMGQGGYGTDQSYLWYTRDGVKIRHQVHILSAIFEDFARAGRNDFLGYSKPFFTIIDGRLVLNNTPVPNRPYRVPWLTTNRWAWERLALVQYLRRALKPIFRSLNGRSVETGEDSLAVCVRLIEDLKNLSDQNGVKFVFVYLPMINDSAGSGHSAGFRRQLAEEMKALNIPFIDLTDDFKKLPFSKIRSCYFPLSKEHPANVGHFTEKGHRYAARFIHKHLIELKLI